MNSPFHPTFEPEAPPYASFVPYTRFPGAERFVEEHLGQQSKAQLPPQHRETFVRALPWINAVFLPFHGLAVLALLGISALSALLGHPLNPVLWLIKDLAATDEKLRAGDLISLGSFARPQSPQPGQTVTVRYDGLPGGPIQVSVRFLPGS